MIDVSLYPSLDNEALTKELVEVVRQLKYWLDEFSIYTQDHRRAYLTAYIQSPGGSVAAKEKDAEFQTIDQSNLMTDAEYRIESLRISENLLYYLMDDHA